MSTTINPSLSTTEVLLDTGSWPYPDIHLCGDKKTSDKISYISKLIKQCSDEHTTIIMFTKLKSIESIKIQQLNVKAFYIYNSYYVEHNGKMTNMVTFHTSLHKTSPKNSKLLYIFHEMPMTDRKILCDTIFLSRNRNTSIISTSSTIKNISEVLRYHIMIYFLLKGISDSDLQSIYKQLREMNTVNISFSKFKQLYRECDNYLWIEVNKNKPIKGC